MFTLSSPHTFWHDHCNHGVVNSKLAFAANLSMITYSCSERRHSPKSKPTPMSTSEMERKPAWERPMKMGGVRFHGSLRVINCGVQTHTWLQKSATKWANTSVRTMQHGVSSLQIMSYFQRRLKWNLVIQNATHIYKKFNLNFHKFGKSRQKNEAVIKKTVSTHLQEVSVSLVTSQLAHHHNYWTMECTYNRPKKNKKKNRPKM